MRYDQFGPAVEHLARTTGHLEGIGAALTPEQLAGGPQEAAAKVETARDVTALIADTKAAIEAGESRETIVALVNAVGRLAARFRDQVLDDIVASEVPPTHFPQ